MNRFSQVLSALSERQELALQPFLTAGFPNRTRWLDLLRVMAEHGADGIELGMPFSDPLADGVTLQRAGARALGEGITLKSVLHDLATIDLSTPVALMSYVNPLLAYGFERLCSDARASGVDAFIVPDLPLSSSGELRRVCANHDLGYVPMVAPTSTDEHLRAVANIDAAFVYCVSLLGVTGARASLDPNLAAFLDRVRSFIRHPLVVGFGLSRREHLEQLRGLAQGAIVGGAVADLIEKTPDADLDQALSEYLGELKSGCLPSATVA